MTRASLAETVLDSDARDRLSASHNDAPAGEVHALAIREVSLVRAGEARLAVSRPSVGGL
jgi:hypothetical protein